MYLLNIILPSLFNATETHVCIFALFTEMLELEETCGDQLVQPQLRQGHPEEAAQSHVQVALEDLQGRKTY